jgi:hypothetical protein
MADGCGCQRKREGEVSASPSPRTKLAASVQLGARHTGVPLTFRYAEILLASLPLR